MRGEGKESKGTGESTFLLVAHSTGNGGGDDGDDDGDDDEEEEEDEGTRRNLDEWVRVCFYLRSKRIITVHERKMGDMDGVTWSRHRRENFPLVFISFLSPLRLVKGDIEHIYTQSHSSSCTSHRNGRSPLAMTMKETKNIVTTDELASVPVAHTLDSLPFECRICQAPAKYSYFGAIACRSCKMFFKRNAIGAKVLSLVSSVRLV